MKKFSFAALAVLAGLIGSAGAGRVPSECLLPDRPGEPGRFWAEVEARPGWLGYFAGGRQIGAWNAMTGESYSISEQDGGWELAGTHCPDRDDAGRCIEMVRNPGMVRVMLQKEAPGYRRNGRICTEVEAMAGLHSGGGIPDDGALPMLTLIGTEADCSRVELLVKSSPALRNRSADFLIQSYRPDNWAVARYGFETRGRPSIYMQALDGKVLFRCEGEGAPDLLAEAVAEAVDQCCPPRKPQPDYQPARDPDPEHLLPRRRAESWAWTIGGLLCGAVVLVWITAATTAGIVLLLTRRRPAPPATVIVSQPPPAAPPGNPLAPAV